MWYLQHRPLDAQKLHGVGAGQDLERVGHLGDCLNLLVDLGAHLVEEEVVDVVGEEGAELALLGLATRAHILLHLLDEPGQGRKAEKCYT